MSNHISYLDIIALGAKISPASFVAKADVAKWPLWGFLARLQHTAFISRKRTDAKIEMSSLDTMLSRGKSLILFPEGTSTDGRDVVDFKSSLFSIALNEDVKDQLAIQPVTIQVLRINGKTPQTQSVRDIYSWHRDMDDDIEMHHHLWGFAKTRSTDLKITFHDILHARDFQDRKMLAKACHEAVSQGLETLEHQTAKQEHAA